MAILREVFLRLSDIFGAVAKVRVRFKLHKYWKTAISNNTRAILL